MGKKAVIVVAGVVCFLLWNYIWPKEEVEAYKSWDIQYGGSAFVVIEADPRCIKSEIINMPISQTGKSGINGGFFFSEDGFMSPPTLGLSISWTSGEDKSCDENAISRGTLVTFKQDEEIMVDVLTVKHLEEVWQNYSEPITAIGGVSLDLPLEESEWQERYFIKENVMNFVPDEQRYRSGMGYKVTDKGDVIYLVVSQEETTLYTLRDVLKEQLRCNDGIMLDGDLSSQLEVDHGDGAKSINSSKRFIYNMVTID